jgi:excisionase family DNA binding protein
MDNNQARIIELLREVHLIAFEEMERLNLRIVELENQNRQPIEGPPVKSTVSHPPTVNPSSLPRQAEMLNDGQVADYLNMSVATLRRWRLFRKGPKFVKIGSAVRYKRGDVDAWLSSCPGLRQGSDVLVLGGRSSCGQCITT